MRAANTRYRFIFAAMGAGLVFAAVLLARTLAGASAGDSAAGSRHLPWGIYQIYWGASRYARVLDSALAKLASRPEYIMFYRDLPRPFPREAVKIIRERGATPIISLELWSWHRPDVPALPRINAGEFDDHFTQWAREARQEGGRVLFRFGFEFNGNWFSWGQDPEGFVAAWRRVHGIFAREGAANVEWVWAPNVTSVPATPANDMHRYYPGDACVTWLGVDGYNWGDAHDQWHRWQSCREIFAAVLDDLARRYPGKPVMIAEFSSVEGEPGRKAAWIRAAHAWLSSRPEVNAAVWFNHDKRREGECDWRIDSSPEALAAFNATFAKP